MKQTHITKFFRENYCYIVFVGQTNCNTMVQNINKLIYHPTSNTKFEQMLIINVYLSKKCENSLQQRTLLLLETHFSL